MIRAAFIAAALLPAVALAQTAPNDPNSPPENFSTTPLPPTTVPSEPVTDHAHADATRSRRRAGGGHQRLAYRAGRVVAATTPTATVRPVVRRSSAAGPRSSMRNARSAVRPPPTTSGPRVRADGRVAGWRYSGRRVRGLSRRPLDQPLGAQRGVPPRADDQVVVQLHAQLAPRLRDLARDGDVLPAGFRDRRSDGCGPGSCAADPMSSARRITSRT